MSQSYEAHQLVIQNLSVVEAALPVVEEVQVAVFSAINQKIKEWVNNQGNWEGVFDYPNDETSFKPNIWDKDDKGSYLAYYSIDNTDEGTYAYYLSPLLGAVPEQFGLHFHVDTPWITRLAGRGTKPGAAWQKYLAEQFPETSLGNSGFIVNEGNIFLPIRIDSEALAENYPESIKDALSPIDVALKKLETAHPEIDALLKRAQEYPFTKI